MGCLRVCGSLRHAHSRPTTNSSLQLKKSDARTLFPVENTCMWRVQDVRAKCLKWHRSRPLRVWARDRTDAVTVKADGLNRKESDLSRVVVSFFSKDEEAFLLGMIRLWSFQNEKYIWAWFIDGLCYVLYMDVSSGWGTFGPVGTGNLFLHAGNQGPNRHVIGQDDQYWTLHAELGDKSSHNNNHYNII